MWPRTLAKIRAHGRGWVKTGHFAGFAVNACARPSLQQHSAGALGPSCGQASVHRPRGERPAPSMIVKKAARAKGSSCATAALLTGLASLLALLLCASSARSMGPNSAALLSVPPSKAWLMDWLWATRGDDFDEYPAVGRITSLPGLLTTLPVLWLHCSRPERVASAFLCLRPERGRP